MVTASSLGERILFFLDEAIPRIASTGDTPRSLDDLMTRHWQNLRSLPTYEVARSTVLDDNQLVALFSRFWTIGARARYGIESISDTFQVFDWVLAPYLLAHTVVGCKERNAAIVASVDAELHALLAQPSTVPMTWLIAFWNVHQQQNASPDEVLHVANGVVFRKATPEENAAWRDGPGVVWRTAEAYELVPFDIIRYSAARHLGPILEVTNGVARLPDTFPHEEWFETVVRPDEVVTLGLRLLQSAWLDVRAVQITSSNRFLGPCLPTGWQAQPLETPRRFYPLGPIRESYEFSDIQCILTPGLINQLATIWDSLGKATKDTDTTVARSRLADAYRRTQLSDELVDLWIALESLYLRADVNRDMTEIAASVIAHYLGKDAGNRDKIYRQVKEAYKWRSVTVHGDRPITQSLRHVKTLEDAVAMSGRWVRQTLLKRLAENSQ